ncbi:MAG: TetR/AcrR family transcriptional regulator [Actinomycetota bacterium]
MTDARSDGAVAWLLAGQQLLRAGGIGAVKLHALTAATGLTTGSFYHHFGGMPDFLDELAAFYGDEQVTDNLATIDETEPRARLLRMFGIAAEQDLQTLDAAMRDWAGSSTAAARAVKATDEALLTFVLDAFTELGYRGRDAELRAQMLIAYGVARVMPPWRAQQRNDSTDVLAILAP